MDSVWTEQDTEGGKRRGGAKLVCLKVVTSIPPLILLLLLVHPHIFFPFCLSVQAITNSSSPPLSPSYFNVSFLSFPHSSISVITSMFPSFPFLFLSLLSPLPFFSSHPPLPLPSVSTFLIFLLLLFLLLTPLFPSTFFLSCH